MSKYSINQETKISTFTPFPAGIVEDVQLKEVKYEPVKEGSEWTVLSFRFAKDGSEFRHVEFPINEDNQWFKPEEYEWQAKRIKHIMMAFMPEKDTMVSGNDFEEFSKNIAKKFKPKMSDKKVAIKVVYDNYDRLKFPKFPRFIQPMEEPMALKIDPNNQYERITPLAKNGGNAASDNTTKPSGANSFSNNSSSVSEAVNQLPF